ncbi:MAG: hypothetical protein JXN59_01420 [Anaerolineae bacterium]|nr:hypothetical protein [Anaerolineae bacterium]
MPAPESGPQPAPEPPDHAPRWLWWGLVALLVLLIGGGGALAGALWLGAADPPLAGPLAWERSAPQGACLDVRGMNLPDRTFPASLVASARVETPPEALTRWGLWLDAPDSAWRWEVLPPGYIVHSGQTWPFFHVQAGVNVLRLDLTTAQYTLWLNRERVLTGEPGPEGAWGLVGGEGVCWQRLALYRPD